MKEEYACGFVCVCCVFVLFSFCPATKLSSNLIMSGTSGTRKKFVQKLPGTNANFLRSLYNKMPIAENLVLVFKIAE